MNLSNFFQRYRRLLTFIGLLAVVVIAAYFIWTLFFQTTTNISTTPGGSTSSNGSLPQAGLGGAQVASSSNGQIPPSGPSPVAPNPTAPSNIANGGPTTVTRITQNPILNPTLNPDGKDVNFYNSNDGKFYRINSKGETVPMSDKVFHDVQKVDWAPNSNKAVLEYPDGSKIVYNFTTNKQVTLPKHWSDFAFSSDSNQLVMKSLGIDPDNRWLITADADGSRSRALEYIGTNDATVYPSWSPNGQSVAMYTQGVDFDRQEMFFVGLNGENFKSTVIEGRGLEYKWAPSGQSLLYSVYNSASDFKPLLWVVNAQGDTIGSNRQSLEINTYADKCAFADEKSLYCAVPETLEKGAGIFPDLADKTKDNLYKIDMQTGASRLIATPDGSYNISSLMVSKDQSQLYFTDKKDNQLYKVDLK